MPNTRLNVLGSLAFAAILAGIPAHATAQAPHTPQGVWSVSPHPEGADMVFEADGTLVLRGPFATFNPARWSLAERVLTITLGGEYELPTEAAEILSIDPVARTVRYYYPRCTRSLNFLGNIFWREERFVCLDTDYSE